MSLVALELLFGRQLVASTDMPPPLTPAEPVADDLPSTLDGDVAQQQLPNTAKCTARMLLMDPMLVIDECWPTEAQGAVATGVLLFVTFLLAVFMDWCTRRRPADEFTALSARIDSVVAATAETTGDEPSATGNAPPASPAPATSAMRTPMMAPAGGASASTPTPSASTSSTAGGMSASTRSSTAVAARRRKQRREAAAAAVTPPLDTSLRNRSR